MFKHWLIDLIGHVSGLSDAQLRQIEKSLPATKALVDLLNRARPIIEQAQNLYTEAEPLIDQAKEEWHRKRRPVRRPMASCSAFGLMPTEGLLPGPAHLALRLHQWLG